MNWFKKLFVRNTNYPTQQLSEKQKEVIELLDNSLVELHQEKAVEGAMSLKCVGVAFMDTVRYDAARLHEKLRILTGNAYMPRSIAFNVDADGNWVFIYAVRESEGSDPISQRLFIDALNRTNTARVE